MKKVKTQMQKTAFKRNLKKSIPLFTLIALPFIWYIVFCYIPMFGTIIAFKDFSPIEGIFSSPFLEQPFEHFERFFTNDVFWQVFLNTFTIGICATTITFIAPIALALFFNELKVGKFKKTIQTISYLPYFVSTVALVNIMLSMIGFNEGVINNVIEKFTGNRINFISEPKAFIPIYIFISLWKGLGWGTIIYTASMASIDTQLYEAAEIEGAGRFRKMFSVTLPGIRPTLIIMMILALPGFLGSDFETILLLQNVDNRPVSEVISTFIYSKGILNPSKEYSYTTAIGLFMGIVNLIIIFSANFVCKKVSETSFF